MRCASMWSADIGSQLGNLAAHANALRQAGFTAIWLPPFTKGASGKASIGYDVFDDYDIGSKLQKNTKETRYGSREELTRCVAMMRANGLDVYADLVENQRSGGTGPGGFTFRYDGANGMGGKGRFPKDAIDFQMPAQLFGGIILQGRS